MRFNFHGILDTIEGKINDAADINVLFFIAVILLKTKAGKTISTLLLSLAPDL